uniref:Uncharacterized protein n=1 Tax=Anguilla anguilla TaxID=7936 RepID=A0A0E9QJS3_ANGAN
MLPEQSEFFTAWIQQGTKGLFLGCAPCLMT